MINLFKKVSILFGASLVVSVFFLSALVLAQQNQSAAANQGCKIDEKTMIISTAIPGMDLTYNPACHGYEFKGNLGDYIAVVYRFFIGVAGIVAVFMVIFGGVQWLFSGGSASKITSAQETIIGAVIGLILALGSYTILYVISPNLTNFSFLEKRIEKVQLGNSSWYDGEGNCLPAEELPCGAYCEPREGTNGETVVGSCEWCPTASDNVCSSSKLGNKATVAGGNCHYADCPEAAACTYFSSADIHAEFADFIPGSIYPPRCSGTMRIVDREHGNLAKNFKFQRLRNFECGTFVNTNLVDENEKHYISSWCDNNRQCVIDLAPGYELLLPITQLPPNGQVFLDIGGFINADCID